MTNEPREKPPSFRTLATGARNWPVTGGAKAVARLRRLPQYLLPTPLG